MSSLAPAGVEPWQYREMGAAAASAPKESLEAKVTSPPPPPGISEAEVVVRVNHAVEEAEQRWIAEVEKRNVERDRHLVAVIEDFAVQRSRYFRKVESDVVQLALAVARKILHREVALDPTLLRGLVRVALDRVGAEEDVRIRLSSEQARAWGAEGRPNSTATGYEIIGDETLSPGDCVLETDRGSVDCGIDEQLKGIEQSFSDLLARRPETVG